MVDCPASAGFVADDAVLRARMGAAAEVLSAAGAPDPPGCGPADHLRRAVYWQRYARGPVSAVHRACAIDLARGSLRLWAQAGGEVLEANRVPLGAQDAARRRLARAPGITARGEVQRARMQLAGQARAMCAALRAELQQEASLISGRGLDAFPGRVLSQARQAADHFGAAVAARSARLAGSAGLSAVRVPDASALGAYLPQPRRSALENRLSTVVGTGFGLGVALTVGRVLADLCPGAGPAVRLGCGVIGVALTWWVVRARRLLTARAALERWVAEVAVGLRTAMEQRVLTVESALLAAQSDAVRRGGLLAGAAPDPRVPGTTSIPDQMPPELRHTPN